MPQNKERISERELYDLRMRIRKVVEGELEALSPEMEKSNVYPERMWDIGRKHDLFRLNLPKQYGGMGLCNEQYFTVLEEIGRGNQAIRMYFHLANGISWEIMADHGSEEMKNKYLPMMGRGEYYCAFALTEKGCGTGVDIRSSAVKKGDKWVINGSKTLISFSDVCDAFYIVAVSDESKRKKGGHTAFFVPADTPGLRMENMPHMMGCRGTGHADLFFENMEIPDAYRMGPEGEGLKVFLDVLAISRASIGVCQLGISQRLLEMSIKRAKDRVTFGKPLISRQAIQQQLADMALEIKALRLLVNECGKKSDKGEDITMISSMVKLHGINTVKKVSDSALEIFGGIGYFEDNPYGPLERLYRDARALWLEEGPPTIQRLTMVREIIEREGELRDSNYV